MLEAQPLLLPVLLYPLPEAVGNGCLRSVLQVLAVQVPESELPVH
jgi:hypothetical protein